MIEVIYGIQYHSQLRRTRPDVISAMESAIAATIRGGGGSLKMELSTGIALFREEGIAFGLELVCILEQISQAFAKAHLDLFGFACIVRRPPALDDNRSHLLKAYAREGNPAGIWVERSLARSLSPYASFGSGEDYLPVTVFLKSSEMEGSISAVERTKLRENLLKLLAPPGSHSVSETIALVGPSWSGKRQVLKAVLDELLGDFPLCRITFRPGNAGLYPLVSAFESLAGETPQGINSQVISPQSAGMTEHALKELFEEARVNRLSSACSPALLRDVQTAVTALAAAYRDAAASRSLGAFFVLENVHLAGAAAISVAVSALRPLLESQSAVVLLTGTDTDILKPWKEFQPKIARIEGGKTAGLPRDLSGDLLEVAYSLYLLNPLFPVRDSLSILRSNGLGEESLARALEALFSRGIIVSMDDPELAIPDFGPRAESVLGERVVALKSLVQREVLLASSRGELRPSLSLLSIISDLGGALEDELCLSAVEEDIDAGLGSVLLSSIKDGSFSAIVGLSRSEPLALLANARSYLLEEKPESGEGARLLDRLTAYQLPEEFPPRYRASLALSRAALHFMKGDIPQCASLAKEALVLLQGEGSTRTIARAYRFMALIELNRERVSEALDYLSFAMESAEKTHEYGEYLIAEIWSSVAFFLWGNYAKAIRLIESAGQRARKIHSTAWDHWSRFFLARLRFETGNYRESLDLLCSVPLGDGGGHPSGEAALVAAWQYRTKAFLGEKGLVCPKTSPDATLFEVEAAYLARNYTLAHSLSSELLETDSERTTESPDLPDWSSGSSLVEARIHSGTGIRGKILRSYRSLALSNMGARSEAVDQLRILIKDEKLSDLDPNDAFYFWAFSSALSASAASSLDQGTVLSLAFKRLQRRASRIDDPELREQYLSLPRWNAALCEDAKRQKLI